ncbi:MAG: Pyridoxine 4-dehydrogenase [Geoglossum umbratile]|nr:MAG: Pyridoxine 4-dehydrogenase [Geoglossum umbratile]
MATITGKAVGKVGFGLMSFTWRPIITPEEQAFKVMKTALARGANFWNGGEFYGTPQLNSLHYLRDYFIAYPEDKDKVVISIKGGLNTSGRIDGREENVRRSVDECLRVLDGKKFLDIFQCARVDPNTPIETTIAALAKYVEEGKIGGIGLSEVRAETIRRAHKVYPIAAVEVELSLWATEILTNDIAATCAELGIPIVAYSPLGRGFLTGQIKSRDDLHQGDFRRHLPRFSPENFPKNFELVNDIKKLAERRGLTPAQIALAWVKAQSSKNGLPTIIPIPGATTEEKVVENMQDVTITDEDLAELDGILSTAVVIGERYGGPSASLMNG